MGDIMGAMSDLAQYIDSMFYQNPKNRGEDAYNKALHDVQNAIKRVRPKPPAESDEKLREIDQDEWHGETLAIRHAEKYWGPREDLEEEEQNNFDAERDAFRNGWNAARANPDPRVAELVKLLREHHNWHLEFTEVPESFVGLNLAAEYCDSDMYERTVSVLDKFERGGT